MTSKGGQVARGWLVMGIKKINRGITPEAKMVESGLGSISLFNVVIKGLDNYFVNF